MAGDQGPVLLEKAPQALQAPLLKWPGGKSGELDTILPQIPEHERYFEPFVGGGAVFFALEPREGGIGDASQELIALYQAVAWGGEGFAAVLEGLVTGWERMGALADKGRAEWVGLYRERGGGVERWVRGHGDEVVACVAGVPGGMGEWFVEVAGKAVAAKCRRMAELEAGRGLLSDEEVGGNIEGALKGAYYGECRRVGNPPAVEWLSKWEREAVFWFVRQSAWSSMFRYNREGRFNVPYGGMSYNNRDYRRAVSSLISAQRIRLLRQTSILGGDFEGCLREWAPGRRDFVFLDPPYTGRFSEYAQNPFGLAEHERLARWLREECAAQWLLVVEETPEIRRVYDQSGVRVEQVRSAYRASIMGRNKGRREVDLLYLSNY